MISVDDLKLALRVTHTAEDDYITALEAAAVGYIERFTGRTFSAEVEVTEYLWGRGTDTLVLRETPGGTLTVVERATPGATGTTIAAGDEDGYLVRGRKLVRKNGHAWYRGYEYAATYTQGYAAGSEPDDIQNLVKQIVAHWYERRIPMPTVGEVFTFPVPHHVDAVLWTWRRQRV